MPIIYIQFSLPSQKLTAKASANMPIWPQNERIVSQSTWVQYLIWQVDAFRAGLNDVFPFKSLQALCFFFVSLIFWVEVLHTGKLTWNTIMQLGTWFSFANWLIWRFHVNLPGRIVISSRILSNGMESLKKTPKTDYIWLHDFHLT